MNFEVAINHPPLRVERDGTVRVGQTRVTLDTLVSAYQSGATPEQIVLQFPSLSLADVYESVGYYLRHTEQVSAYLASREAHATIVRQQIGSDRTTQEIRERLRTRREIDEQDIAAIEESERQIASGQDLDWKKVSAALRKQYLSE